MYLGIGAPGIVAEIMEAILGAFKTKFGGNGFKYENLQTAGVTTFLAFSPGTDPAVFYLHSIYLTDVDKC